jgi:hypothetical protein
MPDKLCPMTGLNIECRATECSWYDETLGQCSIPVIMSELIQLNSLISRIEENSK